MEHNNSNHNENGRKDTLDLIADYLNAFGQKVMTILIAILDTIFQSVKSFLFGSFITILIICAILLKFPHLGKDASQFINLLGLGLTSTLELKELQQNEKKIKKTLNLSILVKNPDIFRKDIKFVRKVFQRIEISLKGVIKSEFRMELDLFKKETYVIGEALEELKAVCSKPRHIAFYKLGKMKNFSTASRYVFQALSSLYSANYKPAKDYSRKFYQCAHLFAETCDSIENIIALYNKIGDPSLKKKGLYTTNHSLNETYKQQMQQIQKNIKSKFIFMLDKKSERKATEFNCKTDYERCVEEKRIRGEKNTCKTVKKCIKDEMAQYFKMIKFTKYCVSVFFKMKFGQSSQKVSFIQSVFIELKSPVIKKVTGVYDGPTYDLLKAYLLSPY